MKLLKTIDLKLTSIKRPGDWMKDMDHGVVAKLVEQKKAGVNLPPITVAQDMTLVKGRKRLRAHDLLGLKTIRADVVEYTTREEAEADGYRENLDRGVPATEERDRILARLVEIYRTTGVPEAEPTTQPSRQVVGRTAPVTVAVEAVAQEAQVSTRTVQRAIARQEKDAQRAASIGLEKETLPDPPAPHVAALKALAIGLRKLEKHIPALAEHWRIVNGFRELRERVFEAQQDSPGAGAEPAPSSAPMGAGRTGGSIPPTGANSKRLQIQDADGKPIADEDDFSDIPF